MSWCLSPFAFCNDVKKNYPCDKTYLWEHCQLGIQKLRDLESKYKEQIDGVIIKKDIQ